MRTPLFRRVVLASVMSAALFVGFAIVIEGTSALAAVIAGVIVTPLWLAYWGVRNRR